MRVKYIWRKRADANWLDRFESAIERASHGACAVVARPGAKRSTVEAFCPTMREAKKLRAEFGGTISRPAPIRAATHPPLRIGNRLTIRSHASNHHDDVLVIPAGAAFGTGEHTTTAMSLRILERYSRRLPAGWCSLDAGTGTGILALAAMRFGACHVIAIDNDPLAIRTAKQNAAANSIRGVRFLRADARTPPMSAKFDLITANLFCEVIIEALPRWKTHLRPDARLIVSGILRQQERAVLRALRQNTLEPLEVRRRGKWIAVLAAPAGRDR